MVQPFRPPRLFRKCRRRRRRKRWSLRRDRAMPGLAANGCGTAAGFGGPVIGLILHTRMPFGWAVIGAGDRTAGTGDRDTGGELAGFASNLLLALRRNWARFRPWRHPGTGNGRTRRWPWGMFFYWRLFFFSFRPSRRCRARPPTF